jgi:hypothetical protein
VAFTHDGLRKEHHTMPPENAYVSQPPSFNQSVTDEAPQSVTQGLFNDPFYSRETIKEDS